jgi:hypothetical protein
MTRVRWRIVGFRVIYAWLTTVDGQTQPHSSLVFFFRDGSEVLVYAIPDRRKAANIEAQSALHMRYLRGAERVPDRVVDISKRE